MIVTRRIKRFLCQGAVFLLLILGIYYLNHRKTDVFTPIQRNDDIIEEKPIVPLQPVVVESAPPNLIRPDPTSPVPVVYQDTQAANKLVEDPQNQLMPQLERAAVFPPAVLPSKVPPLEESNSQALGESQNK
ncbi:hypothetical protein Ciccas_006115 [Cichlidogyrus casuarinus]|uniref:Uncharacterized protein n=1 Tax=Cichlidogyrus casuarinus TaxID=1844966 RepID=A0ABD2Q958_9PLAT